METAETNHRFFFYTKRGTLAKSYSSTLIYWIGNNDKTIDSIESFLDVG